MDINLMTGNKYKEPTSQKNKKQKDPLTIIIVLIFVAIFIAGGVFFAQRSILIKENTKFELSIENTSQKIKELTNSENPAKKIAVAKTYNQIKESRIIWSEIMAKVIKLEVPGVSFRSFSVSTDGEVSSLIRTNNFDAIRNFIANLNSNKDVQGVIINSINQGENVPGGGLEVDVEFKINI